MKLTCPICRTVLENVPEDFPTRPFCSGRCKLVDLGKWLNEEYKISRPLSPEEAAEAELPN